MAWVSLGEALANLVLSLILVRPLGIVGVAIGTGVPVLIANLGILLPAACRAVDVRVGTFAGQVLLAPAVGAVPAIAVCVLLREVLPPTSLLMVVGEAAVTGLVYLACVVGGGTGQGGAESGTSRRRSPWSDSGAPCRRRPREGRAGEATGGTHPEWHGRL